MNPSARAHLAIVGNGMATGRLLDELLRRDALRQLRISVFGEEPQGCYNRILLHRLLAGGSIEDILLKPPAWYAEHGIAFHSLTVTQIDPLHRQLLTADGQWHAFDQLVLATGSVPIIPPLQGLRLADGSWRPGVVPYRTAADCERLRQYLRPGKQAVVIGGGLLGLEAAKTLHDQGMHVTVLHAAEWLMNRQLDAPGGHFLQQALERMGLSVRTSAQATHLLGEAAIEAVQLADGTTLPADLVVLACGVAPRVELARQAGLEVRKGIVVDDQLRTSQPQIYAVGECAEHRGVVYGIVAPLYEQCSVLADLLSGVRPQARYRGSVLYTRLKVAGVDVASMGEIESEGEQDEIVQIIEPQRGIYRKLIIRQEQLVGAVLVGDATAAAPLLRRLQRGDLVPSNRLDWLASPYRRDTQESEDVVCHCHQIRPQQLIQAIQNGCRTLSELGSRTGAGTGCGSCRGQLTRLLLQHAAAAAGASS
jgi:nitrite reductase (NADH) large subunit